MSHSLTFDPPQVSLLHVQVTIINYIAGGEPVSPDEIGAAEVVSVLFAMIPPNQNSLNQVLIPVLFNGKILLGRVNGGLLQEIPPTVNLNALVNAFVVLGK